MVEQCGQRCSRVRAAEYLSRQHSAINTQQAFHHTVAKRQRKSHRIRLDATDRKYHRNWTVGQAIPNRRLRQAWIIKTNSYAQLLATS